MSNSSLVSYTRLSPNHSGKRTHSIDRITPHCVVGQLSVETLGSIFAPSSRQASSNYGIGKDGRVGMYVEEKNRSWCSSSNANDQRAVTIECASDLKSPYAFNNTVWNKLIDLCVDICKRNGKKKLLWLGSRDKTLNYSPKSDEMILTAHRWFSDTACPGNWMYAREGILAEAVTKRLGGSSSSSSSSSTTSSSNIVKGSVVKVVGNYYYNSNTAIPSWVKDMNWVVSSVSRDRVVLGKNTSGTNSIDSAVKKSDLKLVSASSSSSSSSTSKSSKSTSSTKTTKLSVDGSFGPASIKRMQQFFGSTQDGVISGQYASAKKYLSGIPSSCITWTKTGSNVVKKLQKWVGSSQDGYLGPNTIKGLQRKLGIIADGSWGPATSRAFQNYLNNH